jgi:hypothetical protein
MQAAISPDAGPVPRFVVRAATFSLWTGPAVGCTTERYEKGPLANSESCLELHPYFSPDGELGAWLSLAEGASSSG